MPCHAMPRTADLLCSIQSSCYCTVLYYMDISNVIAVRFFSSVARHLSHPSSGSTSILRLLPTDSTHPINPPPPKSLQYGPSYNTLKRTKKKARSAKPMHPPRRRS
ncbi:hypothetical protein EJ05DRAFT_86645 [Pseudovirgaria hyperparasitica]|uniref:Uncharacterized protein n=1 Tax=Pseudovirgaria hyperparasitica TaxID=470096 RepID=A0A6A6W357_9PEZI|nr:uncharacterized protein EJ05DRAFT_86645 [Pseudovirgaria hyperparasitica]KAF2756027.1 hypothetical protein EJ05DRAFT_86645 [Pseudovirgaria hyperparasitica]